MPKINLGSERKIPASSPPTPTPYRPLVRELNHQHKNLKQFVNNGNEQRITTSASVLYNREANLKWSRNTYEIKFFWSDTLSCNQQQNYGAWIYTQKQIKIKLLSTDG